MKKLKIGLLLLASCLFLGGCGCQREVKTYTVTFDSNGGSTVETQTVKEDELVTKPADPTREEYTFIGWYLDLDDTTSYDFSTKVTEDITLYAKWGSDSACTVTCLDGYTLDAENCKCVENKETEETVAVSSVKISASTTSLSVGDTLKLSAKISPTDATDKSVTWKSSNKSIATVSSSGKVTAKASGTVKITVTTSDGSKTATITLTITEKKASDETVSVTSVNLTGSTKVNVNGSINLTATVYPSNATNKSVTYSSSNTNVAKVDNNGVVTGVASGSAVITVTTEDGSYTSSVTVVVSDVYTAQFTAVYTASKISGYTYVVYKNSKTYTDYVGITCGDYKITPSSYQLSAYATATNCKINIAGQDYDLTATYIK